MPKRVNDDCNWEQCGGPFGRRVLGVGRALRRPFQQASPAGTFGPFRQGGRHDTFGLSVCSWRIWCGALGRDFQHSQRLCVSSASRNRRHCRSCRARPSGARPARRDRERQAARPPGAATSRVLGKTRPGEDHAPFRFDLGQRHLLSLCRRLRQMRRPGQIQRARPAQSLLRQSAPELTAFSARQGSETGGAKPPHGFA